MQSLTPRKPCRGRSPADHSPRFLPTDGHIGMYGPPLQRQRCVSAKSASITQAAPQRRELPRRSAHAVVRKSAHQLRTLVTAGIDSRAHLTRVLAQHCAHGGADTPGSLNLRRVSPCHSSCAARLTAVRIPAPNRNTSVRTTRACRCTSLYNSRAQFRAIAGTPSRNKRSTRTRTASSWLHTTHPNGAARVSQLVRRFPEIEGCTRI